MRIFEWAALLVLVGASTAGGATYFVDHAGGSDANPGTSQAEAWRTLRPVLSVTFFPGDVIAFRRGGQWNEGLYIDDSGTVGSPITFTAYGTGAAPVFEAPAGDQLANAIRVEGQSHIVISNVLVRNGPAAGIVIQAGADNVVIRDCEATGVGIGVTVHGTNNQVTGCTFHDLHMVRNTPGGDDDYGAVGVVVIGSGHEIDHNHFEHCIAPSHDYGTDGGAVEFWATVTDCMIHHNIALDTNGFAEIGGQQGDQNHNNVLAYNVAIDTHGFGWYHMSGKFGVDLVGLRIENNTIYDTTDTGSIFGFSTAPTATTAIVRNNIIVTNGDHIANHDGFTHDHNIFWLLDNGDVGLALGNAETVEDPLFVDPETDDTNLRQNSPAVDRGVHLGWSEDVEGRVVPQGSAPDFGAMEYGDIVVDEGDR